MGRGRSGAGESGNRGIAMLQGRVSEATNGQLDAVYSAYGNRNLAELTNEEKMVRAVAIDEMMNRGILTENEETGEYERVNRNLWQYPGEQDRTDRLITTASRASSANQINRAYTALRNHDQHLTMLIERASSEDVQGDVRLLMSMRRRVRQAMRTVSRQL